MMETFSKFSMPFLTMTLSLYTIFFTFAMIGQAWFGSKISTNSSQIYDPIIPDLYFMMNFNDFASSLITLFALMVVNNWMNTTNMLCEVVGNDWPRLYSFVFIMITVWIMLGLVIAFVLEIHDSISDDVDKEWKRRAWVSNLRTGFEAGKMDDK